RSGTENSVLRTMVSDLRQKLDRAEALAASEPQIVITFGGGSAPPDIIGHLPPGTSVPEGRKALDYANWMSGERVRMLEDQLASLRQRGEAFDTIVTTLKGEHVAVDGRAVGGRAVVRLRSLSGDKLALAELKTERAEMQHA